MRRICTAALIAAGLAGTAPAPGAAQEAEVPESYTAEAMHRLCLGTERGNDPDLQSMVCTFRLQGVAQIMIENCASMELGYQPLPELSASIPPSRGALRQAFKNYMEAHPEEWGLPWHIVAAKATSEAFPCAVEDLP